MTARLCVTALRIEGDRHDLLGGRPTVDQGRERTIERCLSLVHHLAAGEGGATPSRRVIAAAVEAEAEHTRVVGRHDPEAWQAAVDAAVRLRSPYDEARARFRLAVSHAAEGDRSRAGRELDRAHQLASPLGAAPLLDQIDLMARRAHLERTRPHHRPGTREVGELTARERDVLRLVAAGRTNRHIAATLFISEKTASVHVSRILAKLGVATRWRSGRRRPPARPGHVRHSTGWRTARRSTSSVAPVRVHPFWLMPTGPDKRDDARTIVPFTIT